MFAAMELDLAKKEEVDEGGQHPKQPEAWAGLGETLKQLVGKWDRGEELTEEEHDQLKQAMEADARRRRP